MLPLLAIVALAVLWGVTFVQVKDALELYPPRSWDASLGAARQGKSCYKEA